MSYTVSEYRAKILHKISKNTKQNIDSNKCTLTELIDMNK